MRREGDSIEKMIEADGLNWPPIPSAQAVQFTSGPAKVQA
jgi:hypothetical protein